MTSHFARGCAGALCLCGIVVAAQVPIRGIGNVTSGCIGRFDPATDVEPLLSAAARRGVPMTLRDVVARPLDLAVYAEALVLSRPDGHIAWRGARVPDDPDGLIDRITGRSRAAGADRSAAARALA